MQSIIQNWKDNLGTSVKFKKIVKGLTYSGDTQALSELTVGNKKRRVSA
jgi:hypothetical protein